MGAQRSSGRSGVSDQPIPERPPPLDSDLVQEFVIKGHADLDGVRELDQGAPLDLFAAAMLGYVDVVRAALETDPRLREARGPHRIPLVQHARAGGAQEVVELLETG